MLVHSRRDTTVLVRRHAQEAVEDDAVVLIAFGELGDDLAGVRALIHVNVDLTLHRLQAAPFIIHVVPRCHVLYATNQRRALPSKLKSPGIELVFGSLEDGGAFIGLWGAELSSVLSHG